MCYEASEALEQACRTYLVSLVTEAEHQGTRKLFLEAYCFYVKEVLWLAKEVVSPRKRKETFVNDTSYYDLLFSLQIIYSISFQPKINPSSVSI